MIFQFKSTFSLTLLVLTSMVASGQGRSPRTDMDSMTEAIRADARADKRVIVTEVMKLKPAESDAFWGIYRRYEAEVAKLNDERISIIKEYADQYASLTDPQAKALVDRAFAWEARRTQLRKTYFAEFSKATSAVTAAKFFQVEHRLDLLIDFLVAAEVPGLFEQTSKDAKQ